MPPQEPPEASGISTGDAQELVSQIAGAVVEEARLGLGSFLTLRLRAAAGSPNGGEWYLWAYQCAWRVDRGETIVCGSEDDRQVIVDRIAELGGAVVNYFSVTVTMEATAQLTGSPETPGSLEVRLFPVSRRHEIQWMLWLPDDRVLTAGPGPRWSCGPRDRPFSEDPPGPDPPGR
jgi:hypothetical protein